MIIICLSLKMRVFAFLLYDPWLALSPPLPSVKPSSVTYSLLLSAEFCTEARAVTMFLVHPSICASLPCASSSAPPSPHVFPS